MLISTGKLERGSLNGDVVIVTGAGGGIGLEAARSLLWLGARVVIAEIDREAGREAEARLAAQWAPDHVVFVPTDVGDAAGVRHLCDATEALFGRIDAVVNNATYAPVGTTVAETAVDVWDRSYAVNLRGPAMLARATLPAMIARKHGVFVCVSSTGGPFMAAYETMKAAQVEFANSLDAELAGTGVIAFTIGPGLVPTQTAVRAIEVLAPRLGMTVEQFWANNQGAVLSVEAAGAGFAAAVALAARYSGQEISSSGALIDAGIALPSEDETTATPVSIGDAAAAIELCARVRKTLVEQADGWKQRSFFERQWMLRDFKQDVGMPVERCVESLELMEKELQEGQADAGEDRALLESLSGFYQHLGQLAQGYVRDEKQRAEQLRIVGGWKADVDGLRAKLPDSTGPLAGRSQRAPVSHALS